MAQFINSFPLSPMHFSLNHSELRTSFIFEGSRSPAVKHSFPKMTFSEIILQLCWYFARRVHWNQRVWHLLHWLSAVQLWDLTLKVLKPVRVFAEVRTSHVQSIFTISLHAYGITCGQCWQSAGRCWLPFSVILLKVRFIQHFMEVPSSHCDFNGGC